MYKMATTRANTKSVNNVDAPQIKIVNTIPELKNAAMGEMYLLISDSATDDKTIHIRTATGWLKSAALS